MNTHNENTIEQIKKAVTAKEEAFKKYIATHKNNASSPSDKVEATKIYFSAVQKLEDMTDELEAIY